MAFVTPAGGSAETLTHPRCIASCRDARSEIVHRAADACRLLHDAVRPAWERMRLQEGGAGRQPFSRFLQTVPGVGARGGTFEIPDPEVIVRLA